MRPHSSRGVELRPARGVVMRRGLNICGEVEMSLSGVDFNLNVGLRTICKLIGNKYGLQ